MVLGSELLLLLLLLLQILAAFAHESGGVSQVPHALVARASAVADVEGCDILHHHETRSAAAAAAVVGLEACGILHHLEVCYDFASCSAAALEKSILTAGSAADKSSHDISAGARRDAAAPPAAAAA
jgi:hypothetical protein